MHGEKIKAIRELRGYTQEHMADKLGIAQNTYSKIENNQTRLATDKLEKIAAILCVPITDILSHKMTIVNFNSESGEPVQNTSTQFMDFHKSFIEKLIASKDEEIRYLKDVIDYVLKDRERLLEQVKG